MTGIQFWALTPKHDICWLNKERIPNISFLFVEQAFSFSSCENAKNIFLLFYILVLFLCMFQFEIFRLADLDLYPLSKFGDHFF